jgi:hypothetical protein
MNDPLIFHPYTSMTNTNGDPINNHPANPNRLGNQNTEREQSIFSEDCDIAIIEDDQLLLGLFQQVSRHIRPNASIYAALSDEGFIDALDEELQMSAATGKPSKRIPKAIIVDKNLGPKSPKGGISLLLDTAKLFETYKIENRPALFLSSGELVSSAQEEALTNAGIQFMNKPYGIKQIQAVFDQYVPNKPVDQDIPLDQGATDVS